MTAAHPADLPVVVVGAGLAGLTAAGALADAGRPVIVVEAEREIGGRLATRRIGRGVADVGAQFFTTRSAAFSAFVADLLTAGVAYEWCRGFNEVDGYPRYAVRSGMAALARHLAKGLDVRVGARVRAVVEGTDGAPWEVVLADERPLPASDVVLTPPIPVGLELLAAGSRLPPGTLDRPASVDASILDASIVDASVLDASVLDASVLDASIVDGLGEIRYHRVLAVLAELDRPPAIPRPGGRQLDEGPFSFVADNAAKGISDVPCVTLHVAHTVSAARWEDEPSAVLDGLLSEARPWLGDAVVRRAELHAWAWSGPVTPWPERCAEPADGIVLAGDAFGGPKVEGAWLSGRAAAEAVISGRPSAGDPGRQR